MTRQFKAANAINNATELVKKLQDALALIERELDAEVEELAGPRNELEELLQTETIDAGMANQLWARLGKFDRHSQQMYARQQTAVERAIEALAHLRDANYHNAMCHDETEAFTSAITIIKAYREGGDAK